MAAYDWVLYAHITSAFLFVLSHGPSIFVIFRTAKERDPTRLKALFELSAVSIGLIHMTLFVLIGTGIALGFMQDWWGQGWVWTSLVVLAALWMLMHFVGSRHYDRVRGGVGAKQFYPKKGAPPPSPLRPEELDELLGWKRPAVLGTIGGVALLLLVWLMRFKPF